MKNEKLTENGFEYEKESASEEQALIEAISATIQTMKQRDVKCSTVETDNWKITISKTMRLV